MPQSDAFLPVVSSQTNTQTCVQVTSGSTSLDVDLTGNEVLVKCLTQPAYIRLGNSASGAITTSNGYYMAIGDEVRWQASNGATKLFYLRGTGVDGALSIAFGTGA